MKQPREMRRANQSVVAIAVTIGFIAMGLRSSVSGRVPVTSESLGSVDPAALVRLSLSDAVLLPSIGYESDSYRLLAAPASFADMKCHSRLLRDSATTLQRPKSNVSDRCPSTRCEGSRITTRARNGTRIGPAAACSHATATNTSVSSRASTWPLGTALVVGHRRASHRAVLASLRCQ